MPAVEDLVSDSSQHVRAAFGNQVSGLAPILGKQETTDHLLPMLLQMLKDDFPDVRLNIISKLEQVNNVIGIELLSQSLLPAIVQLAEDKQWRVRLAIIQYVPLLASQLGVNFFDEKLSSLCMSWLGDTVFSIREASTQNLKKLTEVFGVDWASEAIVPKVAAMAEHPNYLYRMTTCFAVSVSRYKPRRSLSTMLTVSQILAPALSLPVIAKSVIPILSQLVADPIPNIRFNVAKSYAVLVDILKRLPDDDKTTIAELEKQPGSSFPGSERGAQLIRDEVIPQLEKLMQDDDVDVRYFATTASKAWTDTQDSAMET
jgi:serine/threonine-protein phosphatase 2A regulatory subunit A